MTTVSEFCEMLLLFAHDVPLSEWPNKHRRNQFLRLVAKDYDRKEPYEIEDVKREFQVLGQYLSQIGEEDDPLAIVWKLGRKSAGTARVVGWETSDDGRLAVHRVQARASSEVPPPQRKTSQARGGETALVMAGVNGDAAVQNLAGSAL